LCEAESAFFDENIAALTEKYEDEYVAIVGEKVVAHDRDAKAAYDAAKEVWPDRAIYLAQVPSREALIL